MKKTLLAALGASMLLGAPAFAADYVIDNKGAHASIHFKVNHLGYSFVVGRFNEFAGEFAFDAKAPEAAKVKVLVDTRSLDSNHAERDKHLKSADFINADKFPEAVFESTKISAAADGKLKVEGNFTLNGVTKPLTIDAVMVGEGSDPWGGYRAGFTGSTQFALKDYGINYDLGPASTHVELQLVIEGIRK
ncbi:YceI family protein [Shewanella sp. JM162201]|uniref:YceI family protein n=1 Tax=Shewanella jiangmenensis TaxID=2837387 RepID=A0ABS5UZ84_9GAMM|nr:YceI family protein [Shewanella jiangmenensis]MBT1443493.1 YceI family protein [Shewanella jiangmenensis]